MADFFYHMPSCDEDDVLLARETGRARLRSMTQLYFRDLLRWIFRSWHGYVEDRTRDHYCLANIFDENELVQVVGEEQEVIALNTYSVENVPYIVTVSLKRFDEMLNKMDSDVRFPPDINLHKYSSRAEWRGSPVMHSVPWHLRSVVCHRCALPGVHVQIVVVECSRMLCWLACRIPWRILVYNERPI